MSFKYKEYINMLKETKSLLKTIQARRNMLYLQANSAVETINRSNADFSLLEVTVLDLRYESLFRFKY